MLAVAPPEDSADDVTVALGEAQLFSFPQRHFDCLRKLEAEVFEELVVPIPGPAEPWGSIWVMSHREDHRFDAEDRRILTVFASFTGATLQTAGTRAVADARAAGSRGSTQSA